MKTVFLVLAATLVAGTASAQTAAAPQPTPAPGAAAATLPNSFDQPAGTPRQASPPVQSAPAPAAPPSDPAKVAAADAMLKKTIAALQAGQPNYGDMSPELAAKVREQAANIGPALTGLGAVQSVTHAGYQNGAELFVVVFAQAPTQWIIAIDEAGKMRALLFRPVPAPAA